MGEVINLRRRRKAKAKSDAAQVAEHNRAVHGRSKAAKETERSERHLAELRLDGHLRQRQDDD